MIHSSCVEISRSAYRRNLRFLKGLLGPKTLFSSVVKGNAYGHGLETFVPMAQECGVRHFSVFSGEEAYVADRCRDADTDLLIMGHIGDEAMDWAVDRGVAFYVFDLDRLCAARDAARRVRKPARVHLELETGMNRTGLDTDEMEKAVGLIRQDRRLFRLEGICTHLAGAESISNYVRVHQQLRTFRRMAGRVRKGGLRGGRRHTACSAAMMNYPASKLDMVRVGIAQYGYWPNQETRMRYQMSGTSPEAQSRPDPLLGIMRWRSRIMSLKRVRQGDFVGYGTTYQASRRQVLAAVPVGYYHGFSRSLSNLGHVLVRGRRAPVAGYVNMNMMMIDVTDCPGVSRGDEVVIIGKQQRARSTVRSFSDLINYLNYEILVRIPASIPRVVVD